MRNPIFLGWCLHLQNKTILLLATTEDCKNQVDKSAWTANCYMTIEYDDRCLWEGKRGSKGCWLRAWWSLTCTPKHSPSHSQKSERGAMPTSSHLLRGEHWPAVHSSVGPDSTEHPRMPSTCTGTYCWPGRNREEIPEPRAYATASRQGVGTAAAKGLAGLTCSASEILGCWDMCIYKWPPRHATRFFTGYECIYPNFFTPKVDCKVTKEAHVTKCRASRPCCLSLPLTTSALLLNIQPFQPFSNFQVWPKNSTRHGGQRRAPSPGTPGRQAAAPAPSTAASLLSLLHSTRGARPRILWTPERIQPCFSRAFITPTLWGPTQWLSTLGCC